MTPTQATLDEDDSSGSTNSTEFSGGLFQEKKREHRSESLIKYESNFHSLNIYKYFFIARDGAGVTPGLRRRRERAERHKSFLKEQEEAAANGIFAARDLRENYGELSLLSKDGFLQAALKPKLTNFDSLYMLIAVSMFVPLSSADHAN